MRRYVLLVILNVLVSGCVGTNVFRNTSPDRYDATEFDSPAVQATVRLIDLDPTAEKSTAEILKGVLEDTQTFDQITPDAEGLVLGVRLSQKPSESLGSAVASGIGSGLANGLVSGLTLGIFGNASDWHYDYWVEIEGVLTCHGEPVGNYLARGSYAAALNYGSPYISQRTKETIEQSIEHAILLFAAKLKRDRERIESSPCAEIKASMAAEPLADPPGTDSSASGEATIAEQPLVDFDPVDLQSEFAEQNYGPPQGQTPTTLDPMAKAEGPEESKPAVLKPKTPSAPASEDAMAKASPVPPKVLSEDDLRAEEEEELQQILDEQPGLATRAEEAIAISPTVEGDVSSESGLLFQLGRVALWVGGAAAVTGLAFAYRSEAQEDELNDRVLRTGTQNQELFDSAERAGTVADILLVSGSALILAGVGSILLDTLTFTASASSNAGSLGVGWQW